MIKSICTGVLLAVFGLTSTAMFACGCVEDTGSCPCKTHDGDKPVKPDDAKSVDKSGL